MSGRRCSTCKHYDPAPIWRKGWCRNPLLYSSQQSHLVGEDYLDCERGMGNYWESNEESNAAANRPTASHVAPLTLYRSTETGGSRIVYPVSGSSGYRDDPPLDDPDDPRGDVGGGGRQIDYYAEERYWTDYLRIILPILGVLLFLVLLYLWALAFLRGDDDPPGQAGANATATLSLITADSTPSPAADATGAAGTPGIVFTPPPVATTPPGTIITPAPTAQTPDEPAGDIYVGAIVAIANTGGTGANLRSLATTDSDVIDVLLDGYQMEVVGGPEDSQGFIWWNVSGESGSGWVVADYLELIE